MNAMNMPAFTAEASLYKTSGHYRTDPYASSAQTASSVWPAAEVIEIHECNPGFIKLGEWPTMTCIPDPNYTGSDDQGDGPPEGEPTGGGGGTRGRDKSPKGSKFCYPNDPVAKDNPDAYLNCEANNHTESQPSDFVWRVRCGPKNQMWCCRVRRKDMTSQSCTATHDPRIPLGGGIPLQGGGIPLQGAAL